MNCLDNEGDLLKIIEKFQNNLENFQKNHKKQMNLVLLIGQTGCGKSTIFNFLIGADFNINNKELMIRNPQKKFSKMIGGMNSITKEPNFYFNTQNNHLIVDFPGFNDTNGELDQLLFQLLFYKIVSSSPIKVIYVIKNAENSLLNRGNDLQEFVRQLNKQVNGSFQKFNIFLNCYLEDLSDEELEISIRKDLNSVNLSQLIEKMFILRKVRTDEEVNRILNDYYRQKIWKQIESINSFQIKPVKLPKTEIISDYLRKKTLSTIAFYGNTLCDVFDKNYLNLSTTISQQTLNQMKNLLSMIKIQNQQDPLSWYLNFISICEQLATNLKAKNDIMNSSHNFKKIFTYFSQFSNLISGYDEMKISQQIAENQLKRIEELVRIRIEFISKAQEDYAKIKQMENQQINLHQQVQNQNNKIQQQIQLCQNLQYQSEEQKKEYQEKIQHLVLQQENNTQKIQKIEKEKNQEIQKIKKDQQEKYQELMKENEKLRNMPTKVEYIYEKGSSCQLI